MKKISITKEFSWDMAHMLADHTGLCKNLHGHTYKLQIKIHSTLDLLCERDHMVMDFKDLKNLITDNIVSKYDHSFVYWENSNDELELKIANLLNDSGRKTVAFEFKPTAEKMILQFYKQINKLLLEKGFTISILKLWETPTSYAEYNNE